MMRATELLDIIKRRRSIRHFAKRPVPEEMLQQILEAGRWAPSGANMQPRRFLVVTRKDLLSSIAGFSHYGPVRSSHVADAAALIVLLGDSKSISPTVALDCAIAGTNMTLMATALSIGSCWIGAFEEEKIKQLLGIPERYNIVAMIAFGYAHGNLPKPTPRLDLADIVHYENFSQASEPSVFKKARKAGPLSVFGKVVRSQVALRRRTWRRDRRP
jgi:nitroreductase